ncbi:MAG: hypothetical protein LCH61_11235 [Proteobacteria bacterium]|nr:hypothetical protein [Pseudomonadota bacterium]
MADSKARQTIALIASQMEAASSLLKFAADDLAELIAQEHSIFADELGALIQHLQAETTILDGHAAFLSRIDLCSDEEDEVGMRLPDWSAA